MPVKEMTAAGTIVLDHDEGRGQKVLLVHRPSYDDWTLPKGKLDRCEALPACAVRETQEETGVQVRLSQPVGAIRYLVGGGEKEVHYWLGTPVAHNRRPADREVDRVVWLSTKTAFARMSYGDERALLDRALTLGPSTPVTIVRHTKAMDRKNWSGRDQARPLNSRGRRQSEALVPTLQAYGIGRLASSTSTRCLQTLRPYSKASGVEIQGWSTLSEEIAEGNEKAVRTLMKRLVAEAAADGVPLAVCGHRPVLPLMLDTVGLPPRPLQVGALAIAHVDAAGAIMSAEWHKPPC